MTFAGGAVVPATPLLVPAVAAGSAGELAGLRELCVATVADLLADRPARVLVCGDGPRTARVTGGYGDLRPIGVDLVLGDPAGERLPLALSVGAWLLEAAGAGDLPVVWQSLARDLPAGEAAALGAAAVAGDEPVAVLALADGSARRTEKAPGAFDPGAEPLDDEVAAALGAGDRAALLALDPARCDAQWVAGRAGWQLLAGAAGDRPVRAELRAHEAPLGVAYLVARWT